MLPPVTRQYDDCSTAQYFSFVFYCDQCGSKWESEQYPFSMRNSSKNEEVDEKARELLWRTEHDAAYERANTEALFHFNRCPVCTMRVCDDCYSEFDDICISCSDAGSNTQKEKKAYGKL